MTTQREDGSDWQCFLAPTAERDPAKLIEAARVWFELQSQTNTNTLYQACFEFFGAKFNFSELDDVE